MIKYTTKFYETSIFSLISSKVHRMITIPAPLPPQKKKNQKNQKKIIIDKSCQFHVVTLHFQMKNIYFSEISRIKSPFVTFLKYFIYLCKKNISLNLVMGSCRFDEDYNNIWNPFMYHGTTIL